MIAETTNQFIEQTTEKTIHNKIPWQPLSEYYPDVHGFPDFVSQVWDLLGCCEFKMAYHKNSFFFIHNQGIIALIRIMISPGREASSPTTSYAIALQVRENFPPTILCESSSGTLYEKLEVLYMAVLDYINQDISLPSALYEFLQY